MIQPFCIRFMAVIMFGLLPFSSVWANQTQTQTGPLVQAESNDSEKRQEDTSQEDTSNDGVQIIMIAQSEPAKDADAQPKIDLETDENPHTSSEMLEWVREGETGPHTREEILKWMEKQGSGPHAKEEILKWIEEGKLGPHAKEEILKWIAERPSGPHRGKEILTWMEEGKTGPHKPQEILEWIEDGDDSSDNDRKQKRIVRMFADQAAVDLGDEDEEQFAFFPKRFPPRPGGHQIINIYTDKVIIHGSDERPHHPPCQQFEEGQKRCHHSACQGKAGHCCQKYDSEEEGAHKGCDREKCSHKGKSCDHAGCQHNAESADHSDSQHKPCHHPDCKHESCLKAQKKVIILNRNEDSEGNVLEDLDLEALGIAEAEGTEAVTTQNVDVQEENGKKIITVIKKIVIPLKDKDTESAQPPQPPQPSQPPQPPAPTQPPQPLEPPKPQ